MQCSSERVTAPTVLFWNVNRKDLRDLICAAADAVSADVVILIENSVTEADMLEDLKSKVSADFDYPAAIPGRFQLFSRDAGLDLSEVYSGNRVSLRRLKHDGTELLLGIVHFVDKMNWDDGNQSAQAVLLAQEVCRNEERLRNDRTVLIGDFNMNPFDQAMNMAAGMNAMMTRKCVRAGSRQQQEQDYPFFYNPMWGLFGDRTPGPPGTYHHPTSSRGVFGWNMLDQVLVRHAAIEWFDEIQILTSAGDTSLQTELERPNKTNASDHFPILLKLK